MMNRLPTLLRRHPIKTFTATTITTGISYAHYLEYFANKNDNNTIIPRNHFDPTAIANYWEQRPISILKRLGNIVYEVGPVVGEYVVQFQLKPYVNSFLDKDDDSDTKKNELERELSQKLRQSLTNLGPCFVKIGQQLSIRPDLISPTVLYELQKLCDSVPPFDNDIAMKVLAQELLVAKGWRDKEGGANSSDSNDILNENEINNTILSVFEGMPQLVASASLGQVYKATLRSPNNNSGEQVACKIQRPDIFETVTLDLFLLMSYGKLVDKFCSIFTNQIPYHETFINGFANGSFMEMNYVNEANNQIYFRNELHKRFHSTKKKVVEKVIVPKVYEEYTTQRILVSEWIDGVPLAQSPPQQIRQLIPIGVELFLCQLLDVGAFHADPHPGNLYVTTSKVDGVTPILCLLDFGLVANVSIEARTSMTKAIVNLLQGDYDTLIARDAKDLGFLPVDMDVTELKPVLKTILKNGLVDAGSNLHDRKRRLMSISDELNEVFFQHPFSVPPFFALVTRGLGLLEGIALTGDPNFDIFQASYPYAKRRAIETFSVKDVAKISGMLRRTSTRI